MVENFQHWDYQWAAGSIQKKLTLPEGLISSSGNVLWLKFQLMLCLFAAGWKTLFIAQEYQPERAFLIACFSLWGSCRKVAQAWNDTECCGMRTDMAAWLVLPGQPVFPRGKQASFSKWQLILVTCSWTCSLRDINSSWFAKGHSLINQTVLLIVQITTQISLVLEINSNTPSVSHGLQTGLSPQQDVQRTSCHHLEAWRSFHSLSEQKKFCLWLLCEQDQDSYDCHYLYSLNSLNKEGRISKETWFHNWNLGDNYSCFIQIPLIH